MPVPPRHDAHVREPRVRRVLRPARPSELIGTRLIDLFPHPATRRRSAASRTFGPGNEVQTTRTGSTRPTAPCTGTSGPTARSSTRTATVVEFQSVGRDITERRRAAVLTAHQAEILEQVARGVPLDETLATIARTVEDHFPKPHRARSRCSTTTGMTLRIGACPSLPDRLRDAIDGLRVGPEQRFARHGRVPPRDRVGRRHLDRSAVGRATATSRGRTRSAAAWSTPILATDGHTVLGTLDVYSRDAGLPDDEHEQIVFAARAPRVDRDRAQGIRGTARAPVDARPADRAAEPAAVPRPA